MRTTIPGVQKPHWRAPVAAKARASRSRSAGSKPSRVVTVRPATFSIDKLAGDRRLAVEQDGAAPALTGGGAAVLGRGDAEFLPQRRQDMRVLGRRPDLGPVEGEGHRGSDGRHG